MAIIEGLFDGVTSSIIPGTMLQILQNPVANDLPSFSTFLNLTSRSERVNRILNRQGGITLFAPTDDAFRLFSEQVDAHLYPNVFVGTFLSDDTWNFHVEDLLLHHFLPSRYLLADLSISSSIIAMNGEDVMSTGGTFNQDSLVASDISARSGNVIHVVDELLLPAWMDMTIFDVASAEPDEFSSFLYLAVWTGVSDLLYSPAESFNGPYTVFLPTNDAFEELAVSMGTDLASLDVEYVTDILLHHIVLGVHTAESFTTGLELNSLLPFESIVVTSPFDVVGVDGMINDAASILRTDVLAKNGIVHVLSEVVLPTKPDPYLENCLTLKAVEETLGSSPQVLDVSCECYRPPGRDIRDVVLTCTESFGSQSGSNSNTTGTDGGMDRGGEVDELDVGPDPGGVALACSARDVVCRSTHQCCSAPIRKCIDGKCTDSRTVTVVQPQP